MIGIKKSFKDKTFLRYRILFIYIYVGIISLYSCSTIPSVVIPIEQETTETNTSLDGSKDVVDDIENNFNNNLNSINEMDDLSRFKSNLIEDDQDKVEDILLSLEAESEYSKSNYKDSEDLWFKALTVSNSELSKLYFEGWLSSILVEEKIKYSLKDLSSKILELTDNGKKFPYMVKNKLNTVEKMEGFINLILNQPFLSYGVLNSFIDTGIEVENSDTDKTQVSKNPFNIKKHPFLKEAKNLYCNKKMDLSIYEKDLDKYLKIYWNGVKQECDKNTSKAIKSFSYLLKRYLELSSKQAQDKKSKNSKNKQAKNNKKGKDNKNNKNSKEEPSISKLLALSSGYNLINLYRQKGSRLYMSYAYSFIVRLYESGMDQKDLNIKSIEFYEQKINDYLWAARYLAIVKDYPGAKKLCDKVSEILKEFRSKNKNLSLKDRKTFASLEAEKYTVLSGRIYLEEKNYKGAISSIESIKQIKDLPSSWKERIYWNLALFNYLDQNYNESILNLKTLLSFVKKEEYSYQKYIYWLSKNYESISSLEEANEYKKELIEKYPLSFYSIYLSYDSNLGKNKKNKEKEKDKDIKTNNESIVNQDINTDYLKTMINYDNNLSSYIIDSKGYDLDLIYSDKKASFLLRRLELILLSSLDKYYKLSSTEFYSYFKNKYLITKKSFSSYLFISKLLTASQYYIESISLLTKLSKFEPELWNKYPEYVFIYYPKPFLNTYTKESSKRKINVSIPLAISRQESSFRKSAKSFAGALGIMQIMPETGLNLSNEIKKDLKSKDIEEVLNNVEDNIELGTYYLSRLNRYYKNNLYSVFSAYNAGEYMTDLWLEKRYSKDPIVWIETIPFEESKEYVKSVWKNMIIYNHILQLKKVEMTTFDINTNKMNSNNPESNSISTSIDPSTNNVENVKN